MAGRLFASIFLCFLGLGTLITGILIWDVLQRTKNEVAREIRLVISAFHDPIADQVWAYDQKQLAAVLEAMVRLSVAEAVRIDDPHSGRRLASYGMAATRSVAGMTEHRFGIHYRPQGSSTPRQIGNAVLYTYTDIAFRRSWPSIVLILSAAAVKVALLWLLFQYFARRQLAQPLARLTSAVDSVDPAAERTAPIRAVGAEDGELARLQDAFNSMLTRLENAGAVRAEYEHELVAARDRLEEAVAQRTRALESARQQAEDASLAKSRFLAMMSHELRTPLNSILGFSEIMLDDTVGRMNNPKHREYSEDIRRSAQHLLEVLGGILDISRIEAGEIELHEHDLAMRETVLAAERLVRPRLHARNQTLWIDVPSDLPRLRADGRILRQVLVNLLTNSNKFTPEKGRIRVRARLGENDGIVLAVEDTGVGIAPENIPTVLEAFGQARKSVSVTHEGATGLGLTLSKQLVELHGGELSIESEVDKGTTVLMTFPATRTVRRP